MSLGCVLENMWLMAHAPGLGFQVMSVFSSDDVAAEVKELLAIPRELQLAFAVRLGHPTGAGHPLRVRRDLADFTHRDRYGGQG